MILFISFLNGCGRNKQSENSLSDICDLSKVPCINRKLKIRLRTNRGIIDIHVNGENAPLTAGNFVDLVKKGVFDGTVFHRVIKEPVPFIIQGGDPISKDSKIDQTRYGTGSYIDEVSGQVRFVPLEVKLKNEKFPRYGKLVTNPNELEQLELKHEKGSVAMARSKKIDSASAQFYITLRKLPELDGRYAVFGSVINGIEVVDLIRQDDRIIKAFLLD